jgi:hypothetical protein
MTRKNEMLPGEKYMGLKKETLEQREPEQSPQTELLETLVGAVLTDSERETLFEAFNTLTLENVLYMVSLSLLAKNKKLEDEINSLQNQI